KEPSASPQQVNDLSSKFAAIEDRLKVLDRIPDLEKKVTETTEAPKKSSEEKDGLFGDMGAFDEEASGSLFGKGSAPRSLRVVDRSLQKMDETTDARFRHFEKKLDELAQKLSPRAVKSLEKMATSGEKILQEVVPNEVKAEVDRIVNSFSFEVRGLSDSVRKLSQDTESINSETREYVDKLRATEERMKAFKGLAEHLKNDESFIDRMKMAERLKHDEIIISKLKKDLELMQKKVSIEKIRGLEERIDSLEPVAGRLDQGEIMIENINAKTEQLEKKITPAEKMNSIEKRLKTIDRMAEKLIHNEANIEKLMEDVKQQEKQGASIENVRALEGRIDAVDTLAVNLRDDVRHVKTRVETGLGESPLTKLFGIKKGKVILHSIDKMAERLERDEALLLKLKEGAKQIAENKVDASTLAAFEARMESDAKNINSVIKELGQIRKENQAGTQQLMAVEENIASLNSSAKRLQGDMIQANKKIDARLENSVLGKLFGIKKGKELLESAKKTAEHIELQKALIEKLNKDVEQMAENKAGTDDLKVCGSKIDSLEKLVGNPDRDDTKILAALKEEVDAAQMNANSHKEKIVGLEYRTDSLEKAINRVQETDSDKIEDLSGKVDRLKKTKRNSVSKSFIQKLVNARKGKKSDDAFEELEMLFRQGVISRESFEDGMKKLYPQENEVEQHESHTQHSAF
ncbi:MAG: hypothetical protein KAT83_02815, partial [Candidatus Aenigmarchaeota archaeon]|nr:hypothetical protein [Candidatus Aenigmarchaeota archaeon]